MTLEISPIVALNGELRPPSDKSLTHRAYMLAAIADGESIVRMPLRGEDCEATRTIMNQFGMRHEWTGPTEVRLTPPPEWMQPGSALDCGNSGTTIRLLSGLIASRDLDCTLVGDSSLSRRPMKRIAEPLRLMGATVEGDTPPMRIKGGHLHGIDYVSPVASAQVKSCVLFAGLGADGRTSVREPSPSRDHTERMLRATGIRIDEGEVVALEGGQRPHGFELTIPGDISSAAFFLVAAAILPQSRLVLRDLSVNPTRTGILDVVEQAGVPFELYPPRQELGEPVADLDIRGPKTLRPFEISGPLVPRLIDEIPVLAVLATQCEGTSIIRDAREMRVKESDRIEVMANGLRAMGAKVETFEDGFAVTGPTKLKAARIDSVNDHRIAMSFAVAGLIADGTTIVDGAESIATSNPNFTKDLERLSVV